MTNEDVIVMLRAHIATRYRTQRAAALAWGLTNSSMSRILAGEYSIPDVMLDAVGVERLDQPPVYKRKKKGGK
jgi:hypothetical protein